MNPPNRFPVPPKRIDDNGALSVTVTSVGSSLTIKDMDIVNKKLDAIIKYLLATDTNNSQYHPENYLRDALELKNDN